MSSSKSILDSKSKNKVTRTDMRLTQVHGSLKIQVKAAFLIALKYSFILVEQFYLLF